MTNSSYSHVEAVSRLQGMMSRQLQLKRSLKDSAPISLKYRSSNSCTTRSKKYKTHGYVLDCGALDRVLAIDREKRSAIVEPRVTMAQLVEAALPYGLSVPVIAECPGITVGGAINGVAGESSSHRWGCFNDVCTSFNILRGDASLMRVSMHEHPDIFHGIAGSYGSLGTVVNAEIQLIPVKDSVHLRYHVFEKTIDAVEALRQFASSSTPPDFLDGIVFTRDLAVVISGNMCSKNELAPSLPYYSTKPRQAPWYYQHVKSIALETKMYEEAMEYADYVFRYDQGGFWMGAYLYNATFLSRYILQGILKISNPAEHWFTQKEIEKMHPVRDIGRFGRVLGKSWTHTDRLWKFLHLADKWIQDRLIIQDICIPEEKAADFLSVVMEDTGVYPLWLCPIKGTRQPQIFAPHYLKKNHRSTHFINVGIYGIPAYSAPMEAIMRKIERKTAESGGRKVLYSRSYLTESEFWKTYPQGSYELLRQKMLAEGVWRGITDKVLSE